MISSKPWQKLKIMKSIPALRLLQVRTCCAVFIYPSLFMYQVLLPGSMSTLQYSRKLDTSGTIGTALILSRMRFPWSRNFMQNWPQGEPFWNIWSISQSIQWLVLWIMTRIMSPILAVNWYLWLGWCSSGLIVFLIARHFGSSEFGAVCAALFAQMLPWYIYIDHIGVERYSEVAWLVFKIA